MSLWKDDIDMWLCDVDFDPWDELTKARNYLEAITDEKQRTAELRSALGYFDEPRGFVDCHGDKCRYSFTYEDTGVWCTACRGTFGGYILQRLIDYIDKQQSNSTTNNEA